MDSFLSLLLRLSLLGTLLSAALFLLRPVFRGRMSPVYYYLWLPVLLRLCLPVGITLSLPSAAERSITPAPALVLTAEEPAPALPAGKQEDGAAALSPSLPETSFLDNLRVFLKSPSLWTSVWGLGALVCLIWYIGGYLRFSRRIRKSLSKPPAEALSALKYLDPAGRVKLTESDAVNTPMVLGLLRPMILLPPGIRDTERLRDILSHEMIHVRRLDLLYKWFSAITASLHWFNPMMILIRREISRACELSCDEAVIRRMDDQQRRHYGETLLALASVPASGMDRMALTLCEEKRSLKARLTAIAVYRKKGIVSVLGSLLPAIGVCGCALISGAASQAQENIDDALRSALLGRTQILCDQGDGPEKISVSDVPAIFSPDSEYAKIDEFAVVDLDGDGENEVVLRVIDVAGDMGGFLVLRREGGEVRGYPRNYREFESLKTDGTYTFSGPMGTRWGVCTVSFAEGYSPQALVEGQTDDGGETTVYTVSGRPAGEEDYSAAMDRQSQKPDAVWYEFTDENIETVFVEKSILSSGSIGFLPDETALKAAESLERDFLQYWETVKDQMVLPTVNVFCSNRFSGMDLAVFFVYPEYKTTKTLIYSLNDGEATRIGEISSGFSFELSSAGGGMLHTSWTLEGSGGEEDFDAYYLVSPKGTVQTLVISASTFDRTFLHGNLYQDGEAVELTAEEYDSRIGEANRDFASAQTIGYNPKEFRSNAGFDLSSPEEGALADYIFGQISGAEILANTFR